MSRKEVRAEINTLRAELNSWLNTTLSILKTNLVEQSKLAPYTHTLYRGSRRGALDGAKSATACTTSLRVAYKIILVDFNLVVSTLTVKLTAKFKSPPNFPAMQYVCYRLYTQIFHMQVWESVLAQVTLNSFWGKWTLYRIVLLPTMQATEVSYHQQPMITQDRQYCHIYIVMSLADEFQ